MKYLLFALLLQGDPVEDILRKAEKRVTLKSEARSVVEHLADLEKQWGVKIDSASLREQPGEEFPLDLQNVPAMTALAEIAARVKCYPVRQESGLTLSATNFWVKPSVQGPFAFFLTGAYRTRRINFSGAAPWVWHLSLNPLCDPLIKAAAWKQSVKILEAVTDKGVKLELGGAEPHSAIRYDKAADPAVPLFEVKGTDILLSGAPEGCEKIARLRGTATLLIPKSVREYTLLPDPEKSEACDEDIEVSLVTAAGEENGRMWIILRPRKKKPANFKEWPVWIEEKYKGVGAAPAPEIRAWIIEGDAMQYDLQGVLFAENAMDFPGGVPPILESVKVIVPLEMAERAVEFEFTDIPLK